MNERHFLQAHASRLAGGAPRDLADLIYAGRIDASGWPVISGKRVVPESALPVIREVFAARRRRARPEAEPVGAGAA